MVCFFLASYLNMSTSKSEISLQKVDEFIQYITEKWSFPKYLIRQKNPRKLRHQFQFLNALNASFLKIFVV